MPLKPCWPARRDERFARCTASEDKDTGDEIDEAFQFDLEIRREVAVYIAGDNGLVVGRPRRVDLDVADLPDAIEGLRPAEDEVLVETDKRVCVDGGHVDAVVLGVT